MKEGQYFMLVPLSKNSPVIFRLWFSMNPYPHKWVNTKFNEFSKTLEDAGQLTQEDKEFINDCILCGKARTLLVIFE